MLLDVRESGLFNLRLYMMSVMDGGSFMVVSEFGDVVRVDGCRGEGMKLIKCYQLFRL